MRRLKTIDELYEEVRDYGLVITNDAPLETALNARIDTPRIGPLAMTPRHIALLLALTAALPVGLTLWSAAVFWSVLIVWVFMGPHLRFIHPSPDPRGLDGRVRSRRPPLRMVLPEG